MKKIIIAAFALLSTSLICASSQVEIVRKEVISWRGSLSSEKSTICLSDIPFFYKEDGGLFEELCSAVEREVPRKKYRVPFVTFPAAVLISASTLAGVLLAMPLAANKIFNLGLDKIDSWKKIFVAQGCYLAGGITGVLLGGGFGIMLYRYDEKLVEKYREALRECFVKIVEQNPHSSFAQLLGDKDFVENYISYLMRVRYK